MALDLDTVRPDPELGDSFTRRLEESLLKADRERRRRDFLDRGKKMLPLLLLVGPIVGWRLMLSSPDGVHLGLGALAWVTFVLDVGVHVDGSLLSYLGLQSLPSVVGFLIFVLVTATLLLPDKD